MHTHDVRAVDTRQGLSLRAKAVNERAPVGLPRIDALDSHRTGQVHILGPVHHPHPPAPQDRLDAVAVYLFSEDRITHAPIKSVREGRRAYVASGPVVRSACSMSQVSAIRST